MVRRIFAEYLAGSSVRVIAEGLTRDRVPCPSAHDRARNPHRGATAWAHAAVQAIVGNPRYTGRQVWNKQTKTEVLIDVSDVAPGYATRQKWNDPGSWVWSAGLAQEPLVGDDTFAEVQALRAARKVTREHPLRRTARGYALRGILRCGICGRKMHGCWSNGRPHYRCKLTPGYPAGHPKNVYLREDRLLCQLDGWLARKFAPPPWTRPFANSDRLRHPLARTRARRVQTPRNWAAVTVQPPEAGRQHAKKPAASPGSRKR